MITDVAELETDDGPHTSEKMDELHAISKSKQSKARRARKVILWTLICLGFAARIFGLLNAHVSEWISTLFEVNTPRTSMLELKEASFLFHNGVPFESQWFLQPPLFVPVLRLVPERVWSLVFIATDLLILINLRRLATGNLKMVFEFENTIPQSSITSEVLGDLKEKPEALRLLLGVMTSKREQDGEKGHLSKRRRKEISDLGEFAMLLSALNPFRILSCVGRSLSVFTSLATILSARFAMEGRVKKSFLILAIACYLSPYSYSIIPPLIAFCSKATGKNYWLIMRSSLPVFGLTLFSLLYLSALLYGGYGFISRVYYSLLSGDDTSPNLGSLWYLNVEVFTEYRPIFNKAFFIGLLTASLPVTFMFSNDPGFAFVIMCLLHVLIQSEQTTSDIALCIDILSLYSRIIYTKTSGYLIALISLTYPSVFFVYIYRCSWMNTDSISPNYLFFSSTYLSVLEALVLVFLMRAKKEQDWLLHNSAIKAKSIAFLLR